MSRVDLIKVFGAEDAETFNKCSKAYELGREDMFKHIFDSYYNLSDEDFEAMLLSMKEEKNET